MISFSTSLYEREHCKKPRGTGLWGFYTHIKNEVLTNLECPFDHDVSSGRQTLTIIWAREVMPLSKAKKELVDWLKSKGFKDILIQVAD